jgi:carbonic anhydrase/acetyltransferase-like protein (isoleucine patch superfamily)
MKSNCKTHRRSLRTAPEVERLDGRVMLSAIALNTISPLLVKPAGFLAMRPNLPVAPFATPSKKASFVDPRVDVQNGNSVVLGYQDFIGPYALLDGRHGAIKIGNASDVLDNAKVIANPSRHGPATTVVIGDSVVIGFGATVEGPSTIGAFYSASQPTSIGPGALVDGATIEAGAIVSARARVGPGVTVPSGYRVLPGANVTTDAEASDPKFDKVVKVTSSDTSTIKKTLSANQTLAAGYTTLYQGNSNTGTSLGAIPTLSGVYNGNLSTVLGAGVEPGSSSASSGSAPTVPSFYTPHQGLQPAPDSLFPGRITGDVEIGMRIFQAGHHLGRANAIRADQGQPIKIGWVTHTGLHVTINSPLGGTLTIGNNFTAGDRAVILGGPNFDAVIGDNVNIGAGAVVDRTSLGSGSKVGPGAYLLESTFPANTVIPPGAIYIKNKFMGTVRW